MHPREHLNQPIWCEILHTVLKFLLVCVISDNLIRYVQQLFAGLINNCPVGLCR